MSESPLYPGEALLLTKKANAIITLAEHGLDPKWDLALRPLGLGGKEAIGGWLDVTTWRLVFRSHDFNRLTGRFSILLPTVVRISNESSLIVKKLRVATHATQHDFIVWGVPELVRTIEVSQASTDTQEILAQVEAAPRLLGSGLEREDAWEIVSSGLELSIGLATNVIEATNLLHLWEFVNAVRDFKTGGISSPPRQAGAN